MTYSPRAWVALTCSNRSRQETNIGALHRQHLNRCMSPSFPRTSVAGVWTGMVHFFSPSGMRWLLCGSVRQYGSVGRPQHSVSWLTLEQAGQMRGGITRFSFLFHRMASMLSRYSKCLWITYVFFGQTSTMSVEKVSRMYAPIRRRGHATLP